MRYLVVLLVGAFMGAMLAFAAADALSKRAAHARGAMAAMQHHLNRLRDELGAADCSAARAGIRFERLAALAPEIDHAYADRAAEEDFARRAREFQAVLAALVDAPPADCRAADAAWREVSDRCDACHHRHR